MTICPSSIPGSDCVRQTNRMSDAALQKILSDLGEEGRARLAKLSLFDIVHAHNVSIQTASLLQDEAKHFKSAEPAEPPVKKRKVSHAGCKVKGSGWEREFVAIMRELGIPSMRVLASGAYTGAKSDIKVGVKLNADGTYPEADEAQCIMRAECKNRADNPEHLHKVIAQEGVLFIPALKNGSEILWEHLNQDAVSKAVILRRAKVPQGVLKDKDYNQVGMVCMGLSDYATLFRKAYSKELSLEE